jgi:hypothetical protein
MCLSYCITRPRHVGRPNQAQATLPIMWGWGWCAWFGRRRPVGGARGKSRRTPWSAEFLGLLWRSGGECTVRRTLRRISMKHRKKNVTRHNRGYGVDYMPFEWNRIIRFCGWWLEFFGTRLYMWAISYCHFWDCISFFPYIYLMIPSYWGPRGEPPFFQTSIFCCSIQRLYEFT